jgi:hypothetical protein
LCPAANITEVVVKLTSAVLILIIAASGQAQETAPCIPAAKVAAMFKLESRVPVRIGTSEKELVYQLKKAGFYF